MRLGIWMPHPRWCAEAEAVPEDQAGPGRRDGWWRLWLLLLWYVSPHPCWHGDAAKQQMREQREARLWAHVLGSGNTAPRAGAACAHPGPAAGGAVLARDAATLGMLWAEAAGHTSYRATWINVTDGGHYDNLGLVEALRRGAQQHCRTGRQR